MKKRFIDYVPEKYKDFNKIESLVDFFNQEIDFSAEGPGSIPLGEQLVDALSALLDDADSGVSYDDTQMELGFFMAVFDRFSQWFREAEGIQARTAEQLEQERERCKGLSRVDKLYGLIKESKGQLIWVKGSPKSGKTTAIHTVMAMIEADNKTEAECKTVAVLTSDIASMSFVVDKAGQTLRYQYRFSPKAAQKMTTLLDRFAELYATYVQGRSRAKVILDRVNWRMPEGVKQFVSVCSFPRLTFNESELRAQFIQLGCYGQLIAAGQRVSHPVPLAAMLLLPGVRKLLQTAYGEAFGEAFYSPVNKWGAPKGSQLRALHVECEEIPVEYPQQSAAALLVLMAQRIKSGQPFQLSLLKACLEELHIEPTQDCPDETVFVAHCLFGEGSKERLSLQPAPVKEAAVASK